MLDNSSALIQRINSIEARLNALAQQQTTYVTIGNSVYILDGDGNAIVILGEISAAPQMVGTMAMFNAPTGLTGRGLAVYNAGTSAWIQVT